MWHSLTFDSAFWLLLRADMRGVSIASLGGSGHKVLQSLKKDWEDRNGEKCQEVVRRIKDLADSQDRRQDASPHKAQQSKFLRKMLLAF